MDGNRNIITESLLVISYTTSYCKNEYYYSNNIAPDAWLQVVADLFVCIVTYVQSETDYQKRKI